MFRLSILIRYGLTTELHGFKSSKFRREVEIVKQKICTYDKEQMEPKLVRVGCWSLVETAGVLVLAIVWISLCYYCWLQI